MSADHTTPTETGPDDERRYTRGERADEVGAIVVDADDDPAARDEALVVNLPPVTCAEWGAYYDGGEEVSVAEDNPEYDADAEVVVVAFRDELRGVRPEWHGDDPLTLAELECPTYAFPPRRLRRVGALDGGEGGGEDETPDATTDTSTDPAEYLTDAQHDLRDRLAETCDVAVEADPDADDAAVLVVEKLGDRHEIDADGTAEGGAIAGRLEDVAAEYLGGAR